MSMIPIDDMRNKMKYFVGVDEWIDTAYHEFIKGDFNGRHSQSSEIICLHDDVLMHNKGFFNALFKAIPGYDPYDEVVVLKEAWIKVRDAIPKDDNESLKIYEEADAWAQDAFEEYGCFTIRGL